MLEKYHHELIQFLSRQGKDRDTAADLAQESYVRVITLQQRGEPIHNLRALLYRTVRNLLTDQHRRDSVRQHDSLDTMAEIDMPAAPSHWQPEEALTSWQVIKAYVETIEALPPRCKEAFILYAFDDYTQADIASQMGISISMVEKHIVRAMVACKACERKLCHDNTATTAR